MIPTPITPRSLAAAGAAALLVATPLASPAAAASPEPEGATLRIATMGFIDSFNPFTSIYLMPTNVFRYVYDNLVQYDPATMEPVGGLAESWETSEDGTTWTYQLRDGMEWSDGEPITAEDIDYTVNAILGDAGMATANGTLVENIDSVETQDDQTVVFTLKTPQAANPGVELPIVPEHIWSEIDDPTEYPNDAEVVGSGLYTLESYQANQSITLKRNDRYHGEPAKIDGIQYIYYTNADAQVQALRSGEVDFISDLTPEQVTALEGAEGVETSIGTGRRYSSISFNSGLESPSGEAYGSGAEAMKDTAVRQAIRLGTDTETLREQVMQDYAEPATSFVPSAYPEYQLPADDPAIVSFDPDAAGALLDGAGWTMGDDGIREKDGEPLALTFLVDSESANETGIAEFLPTWMRDIGIDLQVETTDSDTITDRVFAGDYDMYVSGWSLSPDPDYQLAINTCASRPEPDGTGATSQDGWCNPEFDEIYAAQRVEQDADVRAGLVQDAQRVHYEDAAAHVLWYQQALEAYRSDRFDGFTRMPADGGQIANQSGPWGFSTVAPVEADASADGDGPGAGLWVAIGAIVVVVGGGAALLVARRRHAGDRE